MCVNNIGVKPTNRTFSLQKFEMSQEMIYQVMSKSQLSQLPLISDYAHFEQSNCKLQNILETSSTISALHQATVTLNYVTKRIFLEYQVLDKNCFVDVQCLNVHYKD